MSGSRSFLIAPRAARQIAAENSLLLLLGLVTGDVIRVLADAGADIDGRMSDGATPLIDVARAYAGDDGSDRVGALEMLLEVGANVNARDKRGRTALMWACAELGGDSRKDVMDLLLRAGARTDDACIFIRP